MTATRPPERLTASDWTFPDVAANLAGDEALLVHAEETTGQPALRFWELDHLAVVLGASCRLGEDVDVEACRADGVPIARRSSGGGTVVIGPGALNVTIVLPIASDPAFRSVDTAQQTLLGRVATAVQSQAHPVVMLGSGDLTLNDRKIAGSAQRRLRHFLMVHASILYDFDLARIDRYLKMPKRQPNYRENRSHADFVANLPLSRPAIVAAIDSVWPTEVRDPGGDQALRDRITDLAARKFRDTRWIERL